MNLMLLKYSFMLIFLEWFNLSLCKKLAYKAYGGYCTDNDANYDSKKYKNPLTFP